MVRLDRADRRLTVARQYHRGTVTQPKGRKIRRVRVSARLDAMLWEHREATAGRDDDLVFTGGSGARSTRRTSPPGCSRPACRAAGVGDWPTWHTFRHTAATMLFRNGWNAPQVSRHPATLTQVSRSGRTCICSTTISPTPDVLESVEQAEVRSALGAVRDAESFDLDEAFVGRVSERLHQAALRALPDSSRLPP